MSKTVKKSGIALVALQGACSATERATSAPSTWTEAKRWSANRKKEVVLRLLRADMRHAFGCESRERLPRQRLDPRLELFVS